MANSRIPLDIQFFATDPEPNPNPESAIDPEPNPNPEPAPEPEPEPEPKPEPTTPVDVQALMVELAKVKRKADTAASEAAEYKKKYRETLSEKEQYDLDKAEIEAKRNEEFEQMKQRLAVAELREQFVGLGYSKEQAEQAAKAQYEGDTATVFKIQSDFMKSALEAEKQKILDELPQPNIGAGGAQAYTKEQFDKMGAIERTKLKRENEAEYNRLLNLSK